MKKRTWTRSFFSAASTADLENTITASTPPDQQNSTPTKPQLKSEHKPTNVQKSKIKVKNWMEIFEPKQTADLAVHTKKLEELKGFFQGLCAADLVNNKRNSKCKIGLVTGPTGAGKTAAVRVLAKENQYEVMEWINPLDENVINVLGDQAFGEAYVVSGLATFKSFLHQASRYKTFGGLAKRLLLIEDFPNALLRDTSTFEEILTDYLGFGSSPIIFIVSDSKTRGLNISYNLFPDELKQKLQINHITFNPVANTIMNKAMKRFSTLMVQQADAMDYKMPAQTVIDSIVLSAQGDIRNALINFHFAALKGAPDVSIMEDKTPSNGAKKSKRTKKQTNLKSVGRDESCTMLHALGRVFNPKFTPSGTLTHSPELIASDYSTEPKKFLDFIQANYLAHFSDIDHIISASDCLSLADAMLQEYRNHDLSVIGLNVATRGLMMANRKPVNGWLPIRGPKRFQPGEGLKPSKLITIDVPRSTQALDFQTFVRVIELSKKKSNENVVEI